jgi:hAT family C-terminal dimerisation region
MLRKIHKDTTPVSEIDQYLDGPLVDWNGLDDPNWVLRWWKANSLQYPIISQVARDNLPIPPAEVDCEHLFSTSRDLLGLRRHPMSPETMKAVLLVRDQYRRSNN